MSYKIVNLLFFSIVLSCNNTDDKQYSSTTRTTDTATGFSASDSNAVKFDLLETLFNNENWLSVNGQDTSFVYCSRLAKTYCKTYYYRMLNGDSTATVVSEIKLSGNDIVWQLSPVGSKLQLVAVDTKGAIWSDRNGRRCTFRKADSSNIEILGTGEELLHLKRTITLSSFLVRSKYDHKNGTRLAYENIR